MMMSIALAGNPNAGKSTIFNALTGSHQHVGNWPGKTVEKKEGQLRLADQDIMLVDLPGTYSLNAFSVEELIARNYIVVLRCASCNKFPFVTCHKHGVYWREILA